MTSSIIISPFCILHYNDKSSSTYHGVINYPTRIQTKDGLEKLECVKNNEKGWKNYHIFYAFSPMVRPIPTGLKLINAIKTSSSTQKIEYAYDPFDIQKNSVSFMTWSQPVPATVPLYLHITPNGDSYPSFNATPPGESKQGWKYNKLSPLYVLVNYDTHISNIDANGLLLPKWKKDKYGYPIFLFKSSDNRCIPDKNGTTIEKCFLKTDEDILGKNPNYGPTSLLTRLQIGIQSKKSISIFKNINPYIITIVVTLFILSLITCVIILSN